VPLPTAPRKNNPEIRTPENITPYEILKI